MDAGEPAPLPAPAAEPEPDAESSSYSEEGGESSEGGEEDDPVVAHPDSALPDAVAAATAVCDEYYDGDTMVMGADDVARHEDLEEAEDEPASDSSSDASSEGDDDTVPNVPACSNGVVSNGENLFDMVEKYGLDLLPPPPEGPSSDDDDAPSASHVTPPPKRPAPASKELPSTTKMRKVEDKSAADVSW